MTQRRNVARASKPPDPVAEAAVPAETLNGQFPRLELPLSPPFPVMEARPAAALPKAEGFQFEPKWDGFRCLVFRSGTNVALQSKAGQPLGRYFPELVEGFQRLPHARFVLDGEIVLVREGRLSFDDLLLRIHPAESRIRKLSSESPATFMAFDLLVDERGRSLIELPLSTRRERLGRFFHALPTQARLRISPVTVKLATAERWMRELVGGGCDGVVAKRTDAPYASGERTAMVKVKRLRTADCVAGGFRWASRGGEVGSLLLGLYDDEGRLNHVGFTSSFHAGQRKELKRILKLYLGGEGFTGRAPGGPSRWSTERSGEWERLDPKLVLEVQYDHFSGSRFRHGTKFLRWRPDKSPRQCTYEQLGAQGASLEELERAA